MFQPQLKIQQTKENKTKTKQTKNQNMGYSIQLAASFFLYASSQRHDSTYHFLCYTSRGALAGTINMSMGPPCKIIDFKNEFHFKV